MNKFAILLLTAPLFFWINAPVAEERTPQTCAPETTRPFLPMDIEQLGLLILKIDNQAKQKGSQWQFVIEEYTLLAIADAKADRMRVMAPIVEASQLSPEVLYRALQADFDAVLDARYAIANGQVWSVFLHPLSSLHDNDFISAVAQVVTAAKTFGSTYSSGSLVFGGGDSNEEHLKLLRQLQQQAGKDDSI